MRPAKSPYINSSLPTFKNSSMNKPYMLFKCSPSLFYSLLHSSTHPSHLSQIHTLLLTSGLSNSLSLTSKLIQSASKFDKIYYAHQVFDQFPQPNIFLYNTLIKLYSNHNLFNQTLYLYSRMVRDNVGFDGFTLPSVLKACSALSLLRFGRSVHTHVVHFGFESDTFVQNGLISMYAKCGEVGLASDVFDRLDSRNVVSWTSIISGLAQNGYPLEALRIFGSMRVGSDVRPDFIALVSVLKAYTDIEDLEHGRCIHALVVKTGLDDEVDLVITLCSMYAKCGQLLFARLLFDRMQNPDVILWNVMISGYAKNGFANEAVDLFKEMVARNIRPDSITITSAILACAQLGSLEVGKWMEDYIDRTKYKEDMFVKTAFIDMYAKCGSITNARRVFETIQDKDVVAWSAIIVGYGAQGQGEEAINLFNEMISAGIKPNDVTFIGILSACNHAGLVDEGWRYFHLMKDYEIVPRHQHYACVVDLLARAGHLQKAYEFIRKMPMEPEVTVWGALLSACRIHSHVSLGELAAERIFDLEPLNAGHYVQLSNIYASTGMWGGVARVRVLMKERGVGKTIGSSSIEFEGKLHTFRVEDNSHPRSEEIFSMVDELERRMNESEFVPNLDSSCLT